MICSYGYHSPYGPPVGHILVPICSHISAKLLSLTHMAYGLAMVGKYKRSEIGLVLLCGKMVASS